MPPKNRLYYGDNLDVMRHNIATDSVDLCYLDPPFNSARSYNVIFAKRETSSEARAQIQAFDDTWKWTQTTDEQYKMWVDDGGLPPAVADALSAFRLLLGENDATAYLVNMAPRIVEMSRVLKPTGSLWLHCDPTMSHYLKVLLDAVFGADWFRNEVVWQRTAVKGDAKVRMGRIHDVILCYAGPESTFNPASTEHTEAYKARFKYDDGDGRGPYSDAPLDSPNPRPNLTFEYKGHQPPANGWRVSPAEMARLDEDNRLIMPRKQGQRIRRKNYLNEQEGVPLGDVWIDIPPLNSQAAERLGYPTQKPLRLLERILAMGSDKGDVVLDPFCGCGTTVDAAERLERRWVGIDVTYLAIDLIVKRLQHTYGDGVLDTFDVRGIPKDKRSALALFQQSPFDFERWAVSLCGGQPNVKQVGDRGIDGVARFGLGDPNERGGGTGRVLISVKGGQQVGPQFVRDLLGTVETQKAELGVLILLAEPTRGIIDAVNHAGSYTYPANGQTYPRVQVATVADLLQGRVPKLPPLKLPYIVAQKGAHNSLQGSLFE